MRKKIIIKAIEEISFLFHFLYQGKLDKAESPSNTGQSREIIVPLFVCLPFSDLTLVNVYVFLCDTINCEIFSQWFRVAVVIIKFCSYIKAGICVILFNIYDMFLDNCIIHNISLTLSLTLSFFMCMGAISLHFLFI